MGDVEMRIVKVSHQADEGLPQPPQKPFKESPRPGLEEALVETPLETLETPSKELIARLVDSAIIAQQRFSIPAELSNIDYHSYITQWIRQAYRLARSHRLTPGEAEIIVSRVFDPAFRNPEYYKLLAQDKYREDVRVWLFSAINRAVADLQEG